MGMINLLNPKTKSQIRAARLNSVLIKYCFFLGGTAILVIIIFAVGFLITYSARLDAEQRKLSSEQAAAIYSNTKSEAEDFASDLSQAKTILSSNLSFYSMLTKISAVVPPGVILSNLSLGSSSLDAPITISARGSSYESILSLKNSLIESSIFSSVNLSSVKDGETSDDLSDRYPIDAILSATFSKDFLEEVAQ